MKRKSSIEIISYRFKRWSRTAYSVFNSVGKAVSIGSIKASIADISLLKTGKQEICFSPEVSGNIVVFEDTAKEERTILSIPVPVPAVEEGRDHILFNFVYTIFRKPGRSFLFL